MKKFGFLALVIIFIASVSSCKRDELNLDNISESIEVDRQIAMPLVFGEISIEELAENNEDSLIVIDGDTVKLVISQDSVFHITVEELIDIPEQTPSHFFIYSEVDTLLPPITRIELDTLVNDTLFTFELENSMRIDRVVLNEGNLNVEVQNNFSHEMTLIISSASIVTPSGGYFIDSITNIRPGTTEPGTFNIADHTIQTVYDEDGNSALSIKFSPVIHNVPGDGNDWVNKGDNLDISFGVDQIDDFHSVFGFFGYLTKDIDTLLEDLVPEMLDKLEGQFNVTNPKIRINYMNSIGVATSMDMLLNLHHPSKPDVIVDLGQKTMNYSNNYLNPEYYGSFLYDRNTVGNIDELIAFPMAETMDASALAQTNLGVDSATTLNWAIKESEVNMDVDIEVPLEFRADLTYTDTMKIRDEAPDEDVTYEIEYAELHYTFKNYFPIGFDGELILYDTINNVTLDTIYLSQSGQYFIDPAPVDPLGKVIKENVEEYQDKIVIDSRTAENILNVATHIIFRAQLLTTEYGSVNSVFVNADSKLNFQFGINAKGKYIAY